MFFLRKVIQIGPSDSASSSRSTYNTMLSLVQVEELDFVCYRMITESLTLEKTSKIIKSNRQPNTTIPTKPCPEVPHLHFFLTPLGMVTPPLPWAACSNAWPLFQ